MRKLFLLLLLPATLYADNHRYNDDVTQINEAGDVVTTLSGGSTRVYGMSGGDMDINQCLATHSILFGLWQGTHVNALCVADVLDVNGRHEEAAEMRCSVRRFKKVYGSFEECVRDTQYQPPPPPEPPKEGMSGAMTQIADYIDEVQEVQVQQQIESSEFEDRIAKIEAGQRASAQKAQERRDYAQFTLERLENDPEE